MLQHVVTRLHSEVEWKLPPLSCWGQGTVKSGCYSQIGETGMGRHSAVKRMHLLRLPFSMGLPTLVAFLERTTLIWTPAMRCHQGILELYNVTLQVALFKRKMCQSSWSAAVKLGNIGVGTNSALQLVLLHYREWIKSSWRQAQRMSYYYAQPMDSIRAQCTRDRRKGTIGEG